MTRKIPKIATADYEVGRGKPPKASRFKPGQSGNPGGRKKGSRNFKTMFLEVLEADTEITEKGRGRIVPTIQALMLSQVQEGLRGKLRAIDSIFARYERYTEFNAEQTDELPEDDEMLLQHALAAYAGRKTPVASKSQILPQADDDEDDDKEHDHG
ncbi:hypothetical protein ASE63_14025 [Bosea sp. Root381]|uniref:DUF5681 domain-containing protein n=1 Tax=Bosea sp. Root381 TaxID=1736524 RepID=UPI0006F40D7B|nr:DUF5681 domain-containing protein [Bosea sp. Root381]KRE16843.1 hypothetical protein ASE63_14025 [Bosea sp. Root381]